MRPLGEVVRHLGFAVAFILLSSAAQTSAWAADITVYAPNIVAGPLNVLAADWTAEGWVSLATGSTMPPPATGTMASGASAA